MIVENSTVVDKYYDIYEKLNKREKSLERQIERLAQFFPSGIEYFTSEISMPFVFYFI